MAGLWGRPAGTAKDAAAYRHSGAAWRPLAHLHSQYRAFKGHIAQVFRQFAALAGCHDLYGVSQLTYEPTLTIMVTRFTELRHYPRYDLRQIHALAALQRVVYVNRSVLRDTMNLGYELADVCRCLQQLTPGNFRHSGRYEATLWYDVYAARFTSPTKQQDDLYIKLSLGTDCLVVNLFSFHQPRAI